MPNDEFEPLEWFSNSTYEPYKEQFLIGLDLNSTFNMSGECIGKTFKFVDEIVQFENNYTETIDYTPLDDIRLAYPLLNFTKMLGTSFA